MNDITFKINDFEGPLDVLLQLIAKHKQNICDIEIVSLVDQYLEFMDSLATSDFELQSEFLEMAARLVYIKVLSLLPENNEAQDLKKELEGSLVDYDRAKTAALHLGAKFCGYDVFVREPVKIPVDKTYCLKHDSQILCDAMVLLSNKPVEKKGVSADSFSKIVRHKTYSVQIKIVSLLRRLYNDKKARLDDFFEGQTRSERVAAFLAVLELTRAGRIVISQDNTEVYFNTAGKIPRHSAANKGEA